MIQAILTNHPMRIKKNIQKYELTSSNYYFVPTETIYLNAYR